MEEADRRAAAKRRIEEMKDDIFDALVEARDTGRPAYRRNEELMAAVGIDRNHHLRYWLITQLALELPDRAPGWALVENDVEGYRLATKATVADLKRQRRKCRTIRTMLSRVLNVVLLFGNSRSVREIARPILEARTQVQVALDCLDREVVAA